MSSEDTHRHTILEFLNDYNNKKSGWTSRAVVENELKKQGHNRKDTNKNIQFLIDEGWIKKSIEKINKISFEKIRISSKGIDMFDNSKFSEKRFSSITLAGTNNVLVMGDNVGTITQSQGETIGELNKLIQTIRASNLTETNKRTAIGDVETIKCQLIKANPTKSIIVAAWSAITTTLSLAANISGAHDLIEKVSNLLRPWL